MAEYPAVTFQSRLISIFHYYSILIGMTSYRFDYATLTYKTTRGTQCAALVANAVTVVVLPLLIWDMMHISDLEETVFSNSLVVLTNYVNYGVRGLAVLYTVLYRYKREQQQKVITLELMRIDNIYVQKLPKEANVERPLARIFYWRYAITVYLWLSSLLSYFTTPGAQNSRTLVLLFFYSHAVNMLQVTMLNYFLTMLFVYRTVSYMNKHLYDMCQQLQAMLHQRARNLYKGAGARQRVVEVNKEIKEACRVLWQLLGVVKQLNAVYHFQMLALRFSSFTTIIAMGYFGAVYCYSTPTVIPAFIIYGTLTYMAMLFDLYFVDLMCDLAVQGYKGTMDALKCYNELPFFCGELVQTCEAFALLLSSLELRSDLCGLFTVNKQLWFQMMAAVLSFTIVLVQFHIVLNTSEAFNTTTTIHDADKP